MTAPSPVVEIWDVSRLVPYELNAKKHPREQVAKLAQAIKKFGWTQPIVVWTDGSIIAGHGRRLAAIHLGLERVPVIVRSDLSKAEADALRLADNKVASVDYDETMVLAELQRLSSELDMEILTATGYSEKDLDFALSDLSDIDESFFTEDVGAAVEKQKAENAAAVEKTDDTTAPAADALGFKRVTIAQSRELRGLVVQVEEITGKTGPEALIEVMRRAVTEFTRNA